MIAPNRFHRRVSKPDGPVYSVASTLRYKIAALRLVYSSYFEANLIEPHINQIRVTPYHLLPTTHIFCAVQGNQVVNTMSLVQDGRLGLPMEAIYTDTVALQRAEGATLAEVTCLADRGKQGGCTFKTLMKLMSLVAQFASRNGTHELLIAVHPRHAKFYQRLLAFESIAGQRLYPAVRNNPAVALRLDLERLPIDHPQVDDRLFGELFPDEELEPKPLSDVQRTYFRQFVEYPQWMHDRENRHTSTGRRAA